MGMRKGFGGRGRGRSKQSIYSCIYMKREEVSGRNGLDGFMKWCFFYFCLF